MTLSPDQRRHALPPMTYHCVAASALALLFGGCSPPKNVYAPPPPEEVDVQPPTIRDAEVFLEFPATTQGVAKAEVRARVKGFLKEESFQPGQFVEEGASLFTIEPEEFEAAVTAAKGNLAQAEAQRDVAQTNYDRRKEALKTKAVSEIDVLTAEAELKAALANVEIATAAVEDAARNLAYTTVESPIAGRVSKALVDIGNLVGATEPTLLTTVVQDDPLYVNFEVSERFILAHLSKRPNANSPTVGEKSYDNRVRLVLSDGSEYPERGNLSFLDNAVNPETGTMAARATFPNSKGVLAAGLFVRVGIPIKIPQAILVPRIAVQRDLGGDFVLIVDSEDKVQRRSVEPTEFSEGSDRILKPFDETKGTGLKAEDRVIVSNLQRARPGATVVPKQAGTKSVDETPGTPK
ncbi:MAG: efflux RND transporter periplasmic adaptor subunit [Verrucomicrobiae bacterium]|nr:efflux RND transporter periplasmic adaptor subunit [Verrucomicrobiae bacterium]MCB1090944.1 efflux RND transporter periplasmic adaptor subunit [Verrucomicrobiae bacterium]